MTADNGPVGSLVHQRVVLHVIISGKERLAGGVYVCVEEFESRKVVIPSQVVSSPIEKVTPESVHLSSMLLPVLHAHTSSLVGSRVNGVKSFGNYVHTPY